MSPRTSTRDRRCSGSWASAASSTAIWSAASLALALPGPQQPGQRLTGSAGAVVDEREHRVEPEPALEGRGRVLLLRVRTDQGGVEIDHDLALLPSANGRAVRPDPWPGLRRARHGSPRSPPPGRSARASISRLTVGIRGHRPEQLGLGADHADVGQAVPTQRDRDRQIQHRLARVMDRPSRPPRRQPRRQRLRQPADAGGRQQHRRARRGDQRLAAGLDTDTRTSRDTLHLRSAFPLARIWTFDKPKFPKPDRHFRALRADTDLKHTKDRG